MNGVFTRLAPGMKVRGVDGHLVGEIKDVHEGDIVIHRRLQPTVHVPADAISDVTPTEVVLGLTSSEVDELYWVHAGEDMNVDLHGVYIYDYRDP